LRQLWLFILAPLVGGAIAAATSWYLYPEERQLSAQDPEADAAPV
jgi:hypothetical protein